MINIFICDDVINTTSIDGYKQKQEYNIKIVKETESLD